MKCTNCKKESQWLEIVGADFICHKCIAKSKLMGLILRTHADTFRHVVKKLELKNYEDLLNVKRKKVEEIVDLKKKGIFLKTTNVVELE